MNGHSVCVHKKPQEVLYKSYSLIINYTMQFLFWVHLVYY